jgi:xylan 1,4-beta-xylosidase
MWEYSVRPMKRHATLLFPFFSLCGALCAAESFPVTLQVDAAQRRGELTPIWRFFGYDEANYTYMKDGRKLLGELGRLGGPPVHIRCHHLLTSGDGSPALKWGSTNIYREDAQGRPIYDWTITDRIFDTYLACGVKPLVEIGFMPEALSSHPEDYPHHPPADKMAPVKAGQAYPPKDYAKWGELAYQWAKHCVEKYGRAEAASWYWEVWNEPNIVYWQSTREDYFKLYDYAVDGVRRALPEARVGGPHTAGGPGGTFLHDFLEHCARGRNYATGQTGAPLDYIGFHAKGTPEFVDGHVRMGMSNQLRNVDEAFAVIASFPEFKNLPVIIGECDPEGCAACQGPQLDYRNGTMYSSYTAASFARIHELAAMQGANLQGALTWAFEFENQPYFAGFRALATNGLDLPVLNVFRMFAQMSGQRVAVTGGTGQGAATIIAQNVRATPDVSALAALDGHRLAVLVWHYHDDDVPGPDAAVELSLDGLPAAATSAKLTHYRIDATHSNSFAAWQRMGSPPWPTPEQYAELERAGWLATAEPPAIAHDAKGGTTLHLDLPRQAVSLLVLEW